MPSTIANTPSPQKPQEFGRYLIIGKLGHGGMGKVYLALEREYDRKVAVKIADPAEHLRDEDIRRFEAEAKTMKGLNHQNIIQVFSYGVVGDRQFIAMRLVEGPTLRERIRRKGKLDHSTVVDYAKQIARGLLYAHKKGVVHRDMKPSNILIDEDERLIISDFGISTSISSENLTLPGMAMGTPEYMSPEQCQGLEVTPQSDIYSFGIILYELLTGSPPFTGDKPLAIAYKQVNDPPPSIHSLRKDVPPQLAAIAEMCLAKRPESRFSSMEQVLNALDAVELGAITRARQKIDVWSKQTLASPTVIQKRRRWRKRFGIALVVAIVLAGVFGAGKHFGSTSGSNGGMRVLQPTLMLDEERLTLLEDFNPDTWVSIPQDGEGRLHSLTAEFPHQQLLYTLTVTLIPTDADVASSLKRTRRPSTVRIENERGQVRTVSLPTGIPGPHFLPFDPISARKLRIKLTPGPGDQHQPVVLSDLAFIGIDLPDTPGTQR